jgi:hypothetical protein
MHRIDTAIRSDDALELESAAQVVDRLVESPQVAGKVSDERKRSLVVALLRADLRAARSATGRARGRLRAAEEAGVAQEVLRALELELDTLCGSALAAPTVTDEAALAEAPPAAAEPDPAPAIEEGSRAL